MSDLISSKIRHRVHFAPDPKNAAFPTNHSFVETRLVSDIKDFPPKVCYIGFDSVVESVVRQFDGTEKTLCSGNFNEELFHVVWTEEGAKELEGLTPISVHPDLVGKVWAFAPRPSVAERQKAA